MCLPQLGAGYRECYGTFELVAQPLHTAFAFGSSRPLSCLVGSPGGPCLLPPGLKELDL